MKLTILIQNIKKLTKISEEFKSGYLYIVFGKNGVGKTSFWQSLRMIFRVDNPNPNIIQFGKKDAVVVAEIEQEVIGGDGEKYIARCDMKEGKEEKFTMVLPDASIRKNKKDIRDIFKYNDFTVEEFLGWGLTEAGRRKQAEKLQEFIPIEVQQKIANIDEQINPKSGTLYFQRAGKNDILQKCKTIYENTSPVSLGEESMLSNEQSASQTLITINKELDALQDILKGNNENIMKRGSLVANLNSYKAEKLRIETRLTELNKFISTYETELEEIPDTNFDDVKFEELKSRKMKGDEYLGKIKIIKQKKEVLEVSAINLDKAETEWEEIDKIIEELRIEKKTLFEQAKLPMDNVIIEDGELFYVENGNKLNFCEEQVSYSIAGKKIAKLLLERNKNLPIICVGKAAEYDEQSLKELSDLAKEYNGIIFADKVVPTEEELKIEVFTNND